MDNTLTATPTRSTVPARDHGASRRAYLDTYARRRSGTNDQVAVVQQEGPQVATVQVAAPAQQFSPELAVDEFVPESQPPVTGETFTYVPVITKAEAPTELAGTDRRSYLDTLNRRYAEAVSQAPEFEETVMQPSLSSEITGLLDEPDAAHEQKIEANLGALYGDYSLTNQLARSASSASAMHVRTIVASSLACGVLALGIFGVLGRYSSAPVVAQPTDSPVIEVDASNTNAPKGGSSNALGDIPQADASYPVRVLIGAIGVNAPVQSLGTTSAGLIDVPKSYGVVGWYNKSTVPGKAGPAVLVGHYTGGNGGVFDKLKDLGDGELVTVTNGKGQTFTYKVTAKNEYEKDAVPMAELFKSSNESKLQIITCSGKWQSKNYTKRLVVTAELVK